MLQTAQSPRPTKASTKSTTLNGKAQAQAIAQAIAKQVAAEPVEILKTAADQLIGTSEKKETPGTRGVALQGQTHEPDTQNIRRKEARHIQAFREELQEIKKLQQQRTQEFRQTKQQAEQQQAQEIAEKKQTDVSVEAPGKQKKGGMMQGVKKKVTNMLESFRNKKSRGIETQKMPSN